MELPSSVNLNRQRPNTYDEHQPLLNRRLAQTLLLRYRNTRKCLSSKAAWLLLLLNFNMIFLLLFLYSPIVFSDLVNIYILDLLDHSLKAFLFLIYPLMGIIADNRSGRYKIIKFSTWMLVIAMSISIVSIVFLTITIETGKTSKLIFIFKKFLSVTGFPFLTIGLAGFGANAIQFGIDQLMDSPWEDQSVFIHWFIWIWHFAELIDSAYAFLLRVEYGIDRSKVYCIYTGSVLVIVLITTVVLLFLTSYKKSWFLIDTGRMNPYKLVYNVTKFAGQHKVPVHRSAFTYCEDEIPSGLDLGKMKYGGPYTTEQVENVKAFYGILKVIFTTSPVFLLCSSLIGISNDYFLLHFRFHQYTNSTVSIALAAKATFEINLAVFIIPCYLLFLRPFVSYYIPGMLKRMGIAMVILPLIVLVFFIIDTLAHTENKTLICMFWFSIKNFDNPALWSKTAHFIEQYRFYFKASFRIISDLLRYMVNVALIEFICSQSPHSMKGLLIGLSFSIKGLYVLLGSLITVIFHYSWPQSTFPSCGMAYYLLNMLFGILAISLYGYVAKRYKYRLRDEPCHVRRYVEDYYSKTQQEENYDYYNVDI